MTCKTFSLLVALLLPGAAISLAGDSMPTEKSDTQAEKGIALPTASPVHLTVFIEPQAQLLVNGTPTKSTGVIRYFDSPPIVPGYNYKYELTATWVENGRTIINSKEIEVTPGAHVSVILDPRAGMKRLPSPPSHP